MKLQGRELRSGDVLYRGHHRYTVTSVGCDSCLLKAGDEHMYYDEEDIQETFRYNPYNIPDDPAPKLLDGVRVGDVLFDTLVGYVTVTDMPSIINDMVYPIYVRSSDTGWSDGYTCDGRWCGNDKHPRLFKSAKHASEYFANIQEEK